MKRLVYPDESLVPDSVSGLVAAHQDLLSVVPHPLFVHRRTKKVDRVALVSGGGSGHEPLHTGYVGQGMLDAACPGDVFTAPHPEQIVAAARQVDCGHGVIFIVKNHAADCSSFQAASSMLRLGHDIVLVNDDVAIDPSTPIAERRGIAGTVVVEKMVGAAAEAGATLAECKEVGDRANSATATLGVAFSGCVIPQTGLETFAIGPDEIEIGVGIDGEPGRHRRGFTGAEEITHLMLDAVLKDLQLERGREVLLQINGLGATPLLDLYLINQLATRRAREHGIDVTRWRVGNHVTALDMAGASITVTALDAQLTELWDAPVHTAHWRW